MTPRQIPKDFWLYENNYMTVGLPGGFFFAVVSAFLLACNHF